MVKPSYFLLLLLQAAGGFAQESPSNDDADCLSLELSMSDTFSLCVPTLIDLDDFFRGNESRLVASYLSGYSSTLADMLNWFGPVPEKAYNCTSSAQNYTSDTFSQVS